MAKKEIRILLVLLGAIAVGVNWTAWESHVANLGVRAMATALSSAGAQHGIAEKRQHRETFERFRTSHNIKRLEHLSFRAVRKTESRLLGCSEAAEERNQR